MKLYTITLQCFMDKHIFYHDVMAKDDDSAFEIAKRYANDDGANIVSVKDADFVDEYDSLDNA